MLTTLALALLTPLLLALPPSPAPQDAPRVVDLPAQWSVGSAYDLTLTKRRQDYRDGTLEQDNQTVTEIAVEIIEARDDGYVVRWAFGEIQVPEASAGNPIVEGMLRIMDGLVLDMNTDEYGTVLSLANGTEVREVLDETLDMLETHMANVGAPAEVIAQLMGPMRETMLSESMEPTLLKEPMLLGLASGGSFELGVELPYEDMLPFPFTGELIPTQAAFLLENVDAEADRAVVTWSQTLDPEATARVMLGWIRETMRAAGQDPQHADPMAFSIDDEARFEFDMTTGIPRVASWSRETNVDGQRRVDSFHATTSPLRVP